MSICKRKIDKVIWMAVLYVVCGVTAQEKTIQRRYVPIVLQGVSVPSSQVIITDWRAFQYKAAAATWRLVPFQADEKDQNQHYHREKDGILDSNDELVFMPEDLGDRAPAEAWPAGIPRGHPRLEFEFSEYNDPQKKAWIYLFRANESPQGYFDYGSAPMGTAADTVKSRVYHLGHNRDGWIDYISLANDFNLDLVDRFKLRIAGETAFGNIGKYAFTEDTLNNGRSTYYAGVVRSFHKMKSYLTVPQIQSTPFDVDYDLHYFPYSVSLGVNDVQLENPYYLVLAGAKLVRQSLDFSPAAEGMMFYSDKNRIGFRIDGALDPIDATLAQSSSAYWLLATGEQGTIMMICEMPNIKNTTMKIYYRDDRNGTTGDGTPDTGDLQSFGDMGMTVTGNVIVTTRVTLSFTVYLLPVKSVLPAFADSLFAWDQWPLACQISEQIDPLSRVAQREEVPHQSQLLPAYPNPFKPEQDQLNIPLAAGSWEDRAPLIIYNNIGQRVATLSWPAEISGGYLIFHWRGDDQSGKRLPAGLYFLTIPTDRGWSSQKILLY